MESMFRYQDREAEEERREDRQRHVERMLDINAKTREYTVTVAVKKMAFDLHVQSLLSQCDGLQIMSKKLKRITRNMEQ